LAPICNQPLIGGARQNRVDKLSADRQWPVIDSSVSAARVLIFYFVSLAAAHLFADQILLRSWIAGEWPHACRAIIDDDNMQWGGKLHKT
jgi:hypothetical protein